MYLMKIYTKTGDTGETSLASGQRVAKSDQPIVVVGELDSTSAAIGFLLTYDLLAADRVLLRRAQEVCLFAGALAASANAASLKRHNFSVSDVTVVEGRIDQLSAALPSLQSFILPGGSAVAAAAHLARTSCRRTERELVKLPLDSVVGGEIKSYINRLSDYLFVLARASNKRAGVEDVTWQG